MSALCGGLFLAGLQSTLDILAGTVQSVERIPSHEGFTCLAFSMTSWRSVCLQGIVSELSVYGEWTWSVYTVCRREDIDILLNLSTGYLTSSALHTTYPSLMHNPPYSVHSLSSTHTLLTAHSSNAIPRICLLITPDFSTSARASLFTTQRRPILSVLGLSQPVDYSFSVCLVCFWGNRGWIERTVFLE